MKIQPGLILLITGLKGSSAKPLTRTLERSAALEELANLLAGDPTARAGMMTSSRPRMEMILALPIYHSGGTTIIEANSEDIRCFYQLVSIVASRDASVITDDNWDEAARKVAIPAVHLGPATERHLVAMQSNRINLVGAASALVEYGEPQEALATRRFTIADLFTAFRKQLAGEGPFIGHLSPATG